MHRRLIFLATASMICATADASPISALHLQSLKNAVIEEAGNPAPPTFRHIELVSGDPNGLARVAFYCGEVSHEATNGSPGPFMPFYVVIMEDTASVISVANDYVTAFVTRDLCNTNKASSRSYLKKR